MRKLNGTVLLAAGVCLMGAVGASHANLLTNGDFGTGDLTGWSQAAGGSVAQTTIAYNGTDGVPAGSAKLDRTDVTLDDNKDILYQIVPVTNGLQYVLDAQWKGNLHEGGDGRNWAEAMVTFLPSNAPMVDGTLFLDSWIQYKKASAGGPNEPAANGWDWESILASPNDGTSPLDGVFTATDDFMLVAFNLGGRDAADPRHTSIGPGNYFVDNVSVNVVPEPASAALLALGALAIKRRR